MSKKLFLSIILILTFITTSSGGQSNITPISKNKQKIADTKVSLKPDAKKEVDLLPTLKKGGKKFRIAIIRSGKYWQYAANFNYLLDALSNSEWMKKIQLSEEARKTVGSMLAEIRTTDYSDYIDFPPDLYFDFEFNEARASDPNFKRIISNSEDVDIIISFGTRASRVLSNRQFLNIPVVAVQISDPVKAGIIDSCEDSGKDFLTTRCDPNKYVRQIKVFHDVVKFAKLGLIYEDTPAGRSIAALEHIERLAKKKEFQIIRNTKAKQIGPEAEKEYLKALEGIAPHIDAMYFTIHGGLTLENLPNVMSIINKYKIPTFAMEGPKFVRHGVLFSISSQEQRATGDYNTEKIVRILKGEKPRSLNQVFNITPMIAINLKEARLIGYDPPVDILVASDEVYDQIAGFDTE